MLVIMKTMKKVVLFLSLIVCTFLLSSCNDQRHWQASLDAADSMVDERPDSALTILDSLERHSGDFTKPTEMRWRLLRLKAQNKCDTVFRSDSLQHILSEYYDKHGTPNERMTAHYLLGRAYSDMGEAPRALQCFFDAVACADTTSNECDFKTLFFVYGQMAMVYRSQCMTNEELAAWNKYSHFALKSGNMYYYIRGIEMTIGSYYDLGDTVSCLRVTEQCRKDYAKHGMHQEAASVFPTAIYIHLLNSNYDKARELMGIFAVGNLRLGQANLLHHFQRHGVAFCWGFARMDFQ